MNGSSDESQGQGFYKPTFKVTEHIEVEQPTIQFSQQEMDDPISIVTEDRPIDFKPRILTTMGTHYSYHMQLDNIHFNHGKAQTMQPIPYNRVDRDKQTRYGSLEAKYKNNPNYKLVYSKRQDIPEYSSYFFSLENTTDYNSNDYSCFQSEYCPESSIFDSRFESGNLLYAYQKLQAKEIPQYDLIMQNDTNTKGYCQWFYFLVRNREHKKIKINLVNFIKKRLMFLDGVRPVGFSVKQNQKNGKGWDFMGQKVSYNKSYITRQIESKDGNPPTYQNYYTLSFEVTFQDADDTVYLALNYPYTYTRMIQFINQTVEQCPEDVVIDKNILNHTISNNAIPYLKIRHEDNYAKNTIFLIGRQHPGETVGSFVLEGFVKELIKNNKALLKKYQFVVIPMINPDGVIYGNFRTNLSGFDLNRQWLSPNRWLHPEVYFVSKIIFGAVNVEFCLDFHGHSKKLNSFIYACTNEKIHEFRVYPYVYSKSCHLFSAPDCTYNITTDKIKTCRVRVFNEIKKSFVYTLETSFFGHNKNGKNTRFQHEDLLEIGRGGAQALGKLFSDKKTQLKWEQQVRDKSFMFDQWAMLNREDYGSQSNPSEDQLNPIQRKKKVMSDAKASKIDKRMRRRKNIPKKESKKKRLKQKQKQKDQFKFILRQKADSATIFDKKPQKILPKKPEKAQSGVIIIQEKKQPKKQLSSAYLQPKFKPPLPLPPKTQQIKTMNPNATNAKKQKTESASVQGSNLFDTARFFQLRDQSFKKKQDSKLEISNLKSNLNQTIHDKNLVYGYNKKSSIRKMPLEEPPKIVTQPKKKNRQKVYVIKENKVVNSITRINEDEGKKIN